ncbi:MAG TPA: hypothetical protein VIG74_02385 [Alphaproteobacteria bacterium]|jgi:hypothetical protein
MKPLTDFVDAELAWRRAPAGDENAAKAIGDMAMRAIKEGEAVQERLKQDPALQQLCQTMGEMAAPAIAQHPQNVWPQLIASVITNSVMVWERANNAYNAQLQEAPPTPPNAD